MLYKQNNISREIIIKHLIQGVCQVDFTKIDGTNRKIYCTLESGLIPSKYKESIEITLTKPSRSDIIPIWDITEGKWKSFKIANVNFFRTSDEFKKQDKSGQDIESEQKEKLDKNKEEITSKAEEKVKSVREQREEIKRKNKKIVETSEEKRKIQMQKNMDQARSIINKLRKEAEEKRYGISENTEL